MTKEERFSRILSLLQNDGRVAYDVLSADLQVSEDTIRRDIEMLHGNGLLTKVRGGAILPAKNPFSFQDRTGYLSEGKDIIARKAQPFIKKDQTIFMDGGTTICTIAAHLPLNASFRVVTNNQALVPVLARFKGIEIIVLGGSYHRDTETNTGVRTCEEVKLYVADLYLMGTCAVDPVFGVTAAVKQDGEVKQAMLQASRTRIAVCNAEKLDATYAFRVCDMGALDVLVTDVASDDARLDGYRGLGMRLV